MPADEFSLIRTFFSELDQGDAVVLGVGDDCALLSLAAHEQLAVSIDTQVVGRHFHADARPADIAYRAVAAAASDLAAMGARPLGMTLALTLPSADDTWLASFATGLREAAADLGLPLVGGDTTAGPLTISVQVMGAVPVGGALLRSGARPGDRVCVSDTLGDSAAALAVLEGRAACSPRDADWLRARFYRPQPALALGQALLGHASAAIDVSDGLVADAGHIASASGVRIELVTGNLPLSPVLAAWSDREQALRWALAGGDDYCLCFCLPPAVPLPPGSTVVGEARAGSGVALDRDIDTRGGYQHFGVESQGET